MHSNTTNVKVKPSAESIIQVKTEYSNTTNVKVKLFAFLQCFYPKINSNTTNVKVKPIMLIGYQTVRLNSNTTNVKVKRGGWLRGAILAEIQIQPMLRLNHVFKGFMFNTIPQKA